MFAMHGVPQACVTDNGPCFAAREFEFMKSNGVELMHSTPYHPATNGLAEKAVQTVKLGVARQNKSRSLEERLASFLLTYRVTPHSTTHTAPCELLMGRRLATRLNRIFPDTSSTVKKEQHQQVAFRDKHARVREFSAGDRVFVKNFSRSVPSMWLPAVVTAVNGPVSYSCFSSLGERKFHVEQMRPRVVGTAFPEDDTFVGGSGDGEREERDCVPDQEPTSLAPDVASDSNVAVETPTTDSGRELAPAVREDETHGVVTTAEESDPGRDLATSDVRPLRRSARTRKQPDRLNLRRYSFSWILYLLSESGEMLCLYKGVICGI